MSASDNLNSQQFSTIPMHELDNYQSADFEVPMHQVPEELDYRESAHGSGQDYVGLDNKPTNVHGYVSQLASDIRKRGWQEPVEVHSDNVVTDGHHRYAAAKKAGLTEVPVRRINEPWFGGR